MKLVFLLFWLAMTVVGLFIWRSGDRIGGRGLVQIGAISSLVSAGIWLVSVGYTWVGSALMVLGTCVILIWLWRLDRAVLRGLSPMLLLCAGAIAAILITELASWLGAPRGLMLALLFLVGASTVAFLAWILVSTARLTAEHFRQRR